MGWTGGRARLGKIRAGLALDLVGLAQLPVLALKCVQSGKLIARRTGASTGVPLLAANPTAQRLGATERNAAHCDGYSASCPKSKRTARACTSRE